MNISERIAKLSDIKLQIEGEINLSKYSKVIKSMKDFVINEIHAIYPNELKFQFIDSIFKNFNSYNLVDKKLAGEICTALDKDISNRDDEKIADEKHMKTIQNLI